MTDDLQERIREMLESKKNNPIDTDPDPSPKPGARKLRRYWTRGKGAAKIRWGVPGDFNRCVRHLRKYVSDPKGLCNVYHRSAIGAPPGKGHGKSYWEEDVETKKAYSSDSLEKLGAKGQAFKNHNGEWSYPIADVSDLKNAIQAFGRSASEDRARLKAYIERRAKALGHSELIPDGWHSKALQDEITLVEVLAYAETLTKYDLSDILEFDISDSETKGEMQELEYKNISTVSTGATETKDDGTVEALVSVTGIVDNVGDIIEPGAYAKTLSEMTPKGVWSHDWNTPVSKVVEVKELMPGDEALPKTLANGQPWPAEAGALYVKALFNLDTQRGREAFSDVQFFGKDAEWSIGYKVPKGGATKEDGTGIRRIKDIRLYEFSPVLFGAASNARSLIKAAEAVVGDEADFLAEVKSVTHIEVTENTPEEINQQELELAADAQEEANGKSAEDRANPVEVALTAESMAQIKALHDQLGAVLEAISTIPVADAEPVEFTSEKTMREAADALIGGSYDAELVGAVNGYVKLLEKALEKGDSDAIKVYANDALDEIDFALQDEKTDDPTRQEFKNLVAAIGKAIQGIEGKQEESEEKTEEEPVVEESTDETKTVKIDANEFRALLDTLKN